MSNLPSGYKEPPSLDDYIGPYEARIYKLEEFIKKARKEVTYECNECGGDDLMIIPEWFMTDDIV